MTHPAAILAVLCLNIFVTEWLVRRTFLKHFGTALLVILVTAVAANVGIIPANAGQAPIYGGIFTYVAPLAIFLPLLRVNLRDLLEAGFPMLLAFSIGAAGTVAGVVFGMWLVGGPEALGESYRALGGMFVGTYTGGSVNFNAIALHYGVAQEGTLFAGSVVVDNILTTIWMVATIVLPRFLHRISPHRATRMEREGPIVGIEEDTETLHPTDLALLIAIGAAAIWVSEASAGLLAGWGLPMPSILILTTIALILAQVPAINRLSGVRLVGMLAVYLFLAVIGALCDLAALSHIGPLGLSLLAFVSVAVTVHGLIAFGGGALLRLDWDIVAIGSQANIGGATSALALARSLGRQDLLLPGILIGSLGTGVGTYLGFLTAAYLL